MALDNLRPRSAPAFAAAEPGLFLSQWRDGQDASRLLFPDLIAALPVKGDPVVLAPTRSTLLVAGADDSGGLLALADAAAETLSTTDQPLSARPLRLRDGQWTDFALDAEELAPFFDLMRGQWTREYAEQKQLLDQLHAQSGDDILVASYAPMQNRHTGKPFCMTFWVDGFVNLLPRARRGRAQERGGGHGGAVARRDGRHRPSAGADRRLPDPLSGGSPSPTPPSWSSCAPSLRWRNR